MGGKIVGEQGNLRLMHIRPLCRVAWSDQKIGIIFSDITLSAEQSQAARLKTSRAIQASVAKLRQGVGQAVEIDIMPEGPETIAYLTQENILK